MLIFVYLCDIVIVMPILLEFQHRCYQSTMMSSHSSHDRSKCNKYIYWSVGNTVLDHLFKMLTKLFGSERRGRTISMYFSKLKVISYSWEVSEVTALALSFSATIPSHVFLRWRTVTNSESTRYLSRWLPSFCFRGVFFLTRKVRKRWKGWNYYTGLDYGLV